MEERGASATDLGSLPASSAAGDLLTLAERATDGGEDLITAATLADSAVIWPRLIALAKQASVPIDTRRHAIFWLGQAAGTAATRGLDSIARDGTGDLELRKQAVFALSQRPEDEGVPSLIHIARSNPYGRDTEAAHSSGSGRARIRARSPCSRSCFGRNRQFPPARRRVRARGYITRHAGHLHPGIVAVVLALMACEGASQPARSPAWTTPRTASSPTFGDVTEGAWLGGSRWAVLAPSNDAAAIADFGTHQVRRVGGRGAAEIRNPSTLFRAGDTLYVGDWGLRRTTLWTLDGQVRSARFRHPMSSAAPCRARGMPWDGSTTSFRLVPAPMGWETVTRPPWYAPRPGVTRADTLARLAPVDLAEIVGDAGRRFERRVFSGSDRWGALPDGSVWVARVNDNRVDWRDPTGAWHRGEALPDRVLEVTRYDRELFLRKFPPELRNTARTASLRRDQAAVRDGARRRHRRGVAREKPCSRGLQPPVSWRGPAGAAAARDPGVGTESYHRRGEDTVLLVSAPARDGARLLRYAISPATATP